MASIQDAPTIKFVKSELSRRQIDTSLVDVKVFRGVVYVNGKVKSIDKSHTCEQSILTSLRRSLRTRREIRDVILDVSFA
jgi:hypothetical protein